jgi:hypothetical protein
MIAIKDEAVDRRRFNSLQWARATHLLAADDAAADPLPMWVADTNSKAPQAVLDAPRPRPTPGRAGGEHPPATDPADPPTPLTRPDRSCPVPTDRDRSTATARQREDASGVVEAAARATKQRRSRTFVAVVAVLVVGVAQNQRTATAADR